MNEIEKMYENAGIEKEVIRGCYEYYTENGGIDIYTINDCKNKDCNTCKADKSIKRYPPFTAEKQLKILCFIVNNKHSVTFHDQVFGGDRLTLEKIQEDLAWAINRIWQDLTEEEKQQVKEILK